MNQINIFSNINALEVHKKKYPEYQDLLSIMELYDIKTNTRSAYTKSDSVFQNVEHYAFHTSELARLISADPKNCIVVLFFPKIFISGFMLPLIQYLIAKNVKYYVIGLSEQQKQKLLLKPAANLMQPPIIIGDDDDLDSLLSRSDKLSNVNAVIQNIVWSQVLPAAFLTKLSERITKAVETGMMNTQQIYSELPKEFFVNLNILNNIINRYRLPLNDILSMFSRENTFNVSILARTLTFFFFNQKISSLKPLLANITNIETGNLDLSNKTNFFHSVFRHIDQQDAPEQNYETFSKNFIGHFLKTRINADPIVAEYLESLPPLEENELKERIKIRQFIHSTGMLKANKDFNKKLTEEEKKTVFTYFLNVFKQHGVTDNTTIDQFIVHAEDSFFRSAVIRKIVNVLKDNAIYWNIESLKKVVLKIDFTIEEIENIFSYLRRVCIIDYNFYNHITTKFEKITNQNISNNLVQLFNLHQQKKLKVLSEFEYIFIQDRELSYVEKFLTTLGKYQLGMKFFKKQEVNFQSDQFHEIPLGYNRVWQSPISNIIFNKTNTYQTIEAHNYFIEKTVQKYFKEITANGVTNLANEYGKNTFNIIYEKIIEDYYCSIGYTQFHNILKDKLFMSEQQLETLGYSKSTQYPEEFIYYNDFYSINKQEQFENIDKYEQFNTIIKGVTENYGDFVNEYIRTIQQYFVDVGENNSMMMIGKNLKDFNRDALSRFRKENIFGVFLKDMLTKFCSDNIDLIRKKNYHIVLALNEKYYFLKYFLKDLLIERNGQMIYFYICYNPEMIKDKLSSNFIQMLDNISNTEFKQDFNKLLTVYKYILQINKYINQLQKLAGILLVYEIVMQNFTEVQPFQQSIDMMGFNLLPDQQKMFICTTESIRKLKVSELMKTPGELSRIHESFSSFNESLSIYNDISGMFDKMYHRMVQFNETFSTIPNIKYAPMYLKLIRHHVKDIGNLLKNGFREFATGDLNELDRFCSEIWKNYMALIKLESGLKSNHRFFENGLKSLRLKYGYQSIDKLILFFKQGFDYVKNKRNQPSSFRSRLGVALSVRDKLAQKEIFFVVPVRGLKPLNIDCIRNIKKIKGLNIPVYVDNKENMAFQEALYGLIPPNHFLDLTN